MHNIPMRWRSHLTALLPAGVSVACYLNGLYGDWLDDDPLAITDNADVACPGGLPELFSNHDLWHNDFWGTPMSSPASHLSYRPLTILSFRLQHCVQGFDGRAFHTVNVVLHALVVLLVSHVAKPLLPHRSQRQAAALLFALHAVHVECVTGAVGRSELLSAIFFFCGIACHQRLLQQPAARSRSHAVARFVVHLAGTVSCALISTFCKEVGITSLLVCGALDWIVLLRLLRRPRADPSHHPACPTPAEGGAVDGAWLGAWCCRHVSLAASAVGLLAFRLSLNHWRSPTFSAADNSAAFCGTRQCRALSISYLYYLNLRLLVLPNNLAHDWSMTTVPNLYHLSDPRLPHALLPYAIVGGLAAFSLVALRRRGAAAPAASLAIAVLPFLPSANIFVVVGFTVAERVLYLPSTGFCMLLALLLPSHLQRGLPRRPSPASSRPSHRHAPHHAPRWTAFASLLLLPLLCMHAILALRRNNDWRTNLALLTSGVAHQPTNSKLRYNLGLTLYREVRALSQTSRVRVSPRLVSRCPPCALARSHTTDARRMNGAWTAHERRVDGA